MRGVLGKKWLKRLTAAGIAGLLIAATSVQSFAVVNLNDPVSLTVNAGDIPTADFDGEANKLVVDIYKVANAVPVGGYDTYDLETVEAFDVEEADLPEGTPTLKEAIENKDNDYLAWQAIAQRAAKAALLGETPMTPVTVDAGQTASGLTAGLFLVITRGSDLTDPADYFKEFPAEDAAATDPTGSGGASAEYLSLAYSDEYEYKFRPVLVAIPGKGAGELGFNTADNEEWNSDVEITLNLKWKRDPRLTSFELEKILPVCEDNGDAMFVFQVTATRVVPIEDGGDGQPHEVYNNVLAINFDPVIEDGTTYYVPRQKTLTIPDLPVGCTVTVREIYSGATYSVDGSDTWESPHPLRVDEVQKASFENKHDDTTKGGGGISNRFEKGESSWNDPVVEKTSVTGGES